MAVKAAAAREAASGSSESQPGRYAPSHHSLGKGGMGSVELATRREGRFVRVYAVKRLSDALRDTESGRAMFMDEARIAGLVRHPNVVSVLDVGEDDRGPYLVMDYVKGLDLASILKSLRSRGRKMPIDVAIRILADAAAGLHAAHELRGTHGETLGLVHRDVSPHNVLVDFEGVVRLTDFGIAKAVGRLAKTSTGILKGKVEYMAPEQLRFEQLDRRADLFALGAIGWEMLAGRRLFAAETANEVARAVLAADVPDLAAHRDDVPPSLHELLLEMLAADPAKRPKSAFEVKRRLEGALRDWAFASGEPRELSEFLAESFEEHRAQVETMYAAVLASAELAGAPEGALVPFGPSTDVDLASVVSAERPVPMNRSRRLAFLVVSALALIAVAVVVAVVLFGGDGPADDPEEATPVTAAEPSPAPSPAPSTDLAEAAAALQTEQPGAAEEPTDSDAPTGDDPAAAMADEARPGHVRHRPRPGMSRPATMQTTMSSGVEGIWLPREQRAN